MPGEGVRGGKENPVPFNCMTESSGGGVTLGIDRRIPELQILAAPSRFGRRLLALRSATRASLWTCPDVLAFAMAEPTRSII